MNEVQLAAWVASLGQGRVWATAATLIDAKCIDGTVLSTMSPIEIHTVLELPLLQHANIIHTRLHAVPAQIEVHVHLTHVTCCESVFHLSIGVSRSVFVFSAKLPTQGPCPI
jgi:hypothetical protein